jgi:hypothetical protein
MLKPWSAAAFLHASALVIGAKPTIEQVLVVNGFKLNFMSDESSGENDR